MPRYEDLLEPPHVIGTGRYEDFLEPGEFQSRQENIAKGLTPGGLTPQQQAEGRQFYTETLPRTAVATGASIASAPFTGGMSLLPAVATEGGFVAGGDVAYQALRKLFDPTRDINLRESAEMGASAGIGSGMTRG